MSNTYEFRVSHARELTLQEQREPQQLIQRPPMVTLALKEEAQVFLQCFDIEVTASYTLTS